MRIVATSHPAIGQVNESIWAQVIEFPQASGIIEVHSSYSAAREMGIAVMTNLRRILDKFGMDPSSVMENLKKELPKEVVSLLLIIPKGDKVTLIKLGEGYFYLVRRKKVMLFNSKEGRMTGQVNIGDVFIAISSGVISTFESKLNEILSPELSARETGDTLSILFGKHEEAAGLCGLVFEVQSFADEKTGALPTQTEKPVLLEKKRTFRISNIRKIINREWIIKYRFLLLAGFVGLIFIFSVILGIRRQMNDTGYTKMVEAYSQANELFNEGVATLSIDEGKSRELLAKARDLLAPYLSDKLPPGKETRNIKDLSLKISDNLSIVSKVFKREMALFYDASFLRKDRVINEIALKANNLYMLDNSAGMLAVVSVDSKNAELLAGGEKITSIKSFSATGTQIYGLSSDGVVTLLPKSSELKVVIPQDEIKNSPEILTTFGNNIYLLSKSSNVLWRYVKNANTFEKPVNYFNENTAPDLSGVTNLVIDGSVWMGSTQGKIYKYTQGTDDPFIVRGVDPPLGQNIKVYTDEDAMALYVLDSSNKRMVVLSKDGGYLGQYTWPDDTQITSFAVSESKKRAFFVMGQKIYSFALQ